MSGGSRGAWVHGPSSDKSECNSCSSAPAPRQPTVCCVLMLCTVQRALQSNMLLDGLICISIYKCVLQNHFLFCPIAAWHRIYHLQASISSNTYLLTLLGKHIKLFHFHMRGLNRWKRNVKNWLPTNQVPKVYFNYHLLKYLCRLLKRNLPK